MKLLNYIFYFSSCLYRKYENHPWDAGSVIVSGYLTGILIIIINMVMFMLNKQTTLQHAATIPFCIGIPLAIINLFIFNQRKFFELDKKWSETSKKTFKGILILCTFLIVALATALTSTLVIM